MKNFNLKSNKKIILIFAIVVLFWIIALVVSFFIGKNNSNPADESLKIENEIEEKTDNSIQLDEKKNFIYASETNYKGNLKDYPELYNTPFKRSEFYVSNKEYAAIEGNDKIIKIMNQRCVDFVDKLLNTSPDDIAVDFPGWLAKVSALTKSSDDKLIWGESQSVDDYYFISMRDYLQSIGEYLVDNNVSMDAKFITDETMCYTDIFTFNRGMLVFTINHNDDANCKYEVGKEYRIPIDVPFSIYNTDKVSQVYQILDFEGVQKNTVYLYDQDEEDSSFSD